MHFDDEKLNKTNGKRRKIDLVAQAFYRANLFQLRLGYKSLFHNLWIRFCELYLGEIQVTLCSLGEKGRKFLEDCCRNKWIYNKNMCCSRAKFYNCLNKYSEKFLSLFDHKLFDRIMTQLRKMLNSSSCPPQTDELNN